MNPAIGFVLLVLIVVGWLITTECAVQLVFEVIDYWRRYHGRK